MITDIDRLHKVVTGELTGRGCGKTFASCHELFGVLMTSKENVIVCYINHWKDLDYILPMFRKILDEYGYIIKEQSISWNKRYLFENGKEIRFITQSMLDYDFRSGRLFAGLDYNLVDFRDY